MTNYSQQILSNIAKSEFNNQDLMAKAINHDTTEDLISLSDSLLEQGFVDDAKGLLESLQEHHKVNDAGNINLAEIYIDEGDDDAALALIDKISEKSSLYLAAQIDKADLYESEGLLESAEGILLDLQNVSDDPLVRFALAEFYDAEGENGKSAQLYDYLIDQGHERIGDIDLHERLANALASNGEFEESIGEFETVGLKNLSAKENGLLARAYLQVGDEQKAQALLEKNIENEEASLEDYLNLAEALLKEGNIEGQIRSLQLAKNFDPFNIQTRFQLALAQSNAKQYSLSDSELAEIVKKDPSQTQAISLLAYNLLQEKQDDQVLSLLNAHIEDEEIDQHYFWYLGLAYFHLDQQATAEKNFNQVKKYFANEPAFLKDAFFIFKNTDTTQARIFLENYLKLVPDDFEMANYLLS